MTVVRQTLTVVLPVLDEAACAAELVQRRPALQRAWASQAALHTACLAMVPGSAKGTQAALLFECSFEGELRELAASLYRAEGGAFHALLAQCEGYAAADALAFADYLSARARRAAPLAEPGARDSRGSWELASAALSFVSAWLRSSNAHQASAEAQEQQRAALGPQESTLGVPVLHVARVREAPRALGRLKSAIRSAEQAPLQMAHGARFLVHGGRVLFLAYPDQPLPLWSEQLCRHALFALARVWSNVVGFPRLSWRRARSERRLQHFLLDYRVPVAAWFNAEDPLREA